MPKTKAHTRYLTKDGVRCKGVTTIINNLGWNKQVLMAWTRRMALAGEDPEAVMKEAGAIGTLAHYLCESHIKGEEPDMTDYSSEQIEKAENAFLGYLEWEKMTKPKYEAIELKMKLQKDYMEAEFVMNDCVTQIQQMQLKINQLAQRRDKEYEKMQKLSSALEFL